MTTRRRQRASLAGFLSPVGQGAVDVGDGVGGFAAGLAVQCSTLRSLNENGRDSPTQGVVLADGTCEHSESGRHWHSREGAMMCEEMAPRAASDTTDDTLIGEKSQDVARKAWEDGSRNFSWVNQHVGELQRYVGQWVCVADERVVLADADRARFLQRLKTGRWQKPGRAPYIFYVPRNEELHAVHPGFHALDVSVHSK
jgi:hypothetical protein